MNDDEQSMTEEEAYGELFKPLPDYLKYVEDMEKLDAFYGALHPLNIGPMTHLGHRIGWKTHIIGVSVTQDETQVDVIRGNQTEVKNAQRDPSIRGSLVNVQLLDEDGLETDIIFRFHKGQTYVGVNHGEGLVEEPREFIAANELWRN